MPTPLSNEQPAFDSISQTAQGLYFLRQLTDLVGAHFQYVPLERLDDGALVWRLEGQRAWGFLLQRSAEPEDGIARMSWGFRLVAPVPPTLVVQGTLVAQRPQAEQTGEGGQPTADISTGAPSTEAPSTETPSPAEPSTAAQPTAGDQHDRADLTFLPRQPPAPLLDVPNETFADLAQRYPPKNQPGNEALRDRVERLLFTLVDAFETDRSGDVSVQYGSTRVFVRVIDREPSTLSVWAVTNLDITPTPEFYEYIATHADRWFFGHLSAYLDDQGKAFCTFSHRLYGEFLDDDEFTATIRMIGGTADDIDDQLQQQFGGRVFSAPPAAADVPTRPDDPPIGMYL